MTSVTPLLILILGAIASFGMLFSLGGNDVANSIGIATGSGALSTRYAVAIAAVMNVVGAFLAGNKVTTNIADDFDPALAESQASTSTLLLNALSYLCALLASIAVITSGTFLGLPLSSTHAVIGGIVGVGIVTHGLSSVNFSFVEEVVFAWFTSPLLGALLTVITRLLIIRASKSPTSYMFVIPFIAGITACSALAIPCVVGPAVLKRVFASSRLQFAVESLLVFTAVSIFTWRYVRSRLSSQLDLILVPSSTSNGLPTPPDKALNSTMSEKEQQRLEKEELPTGDTESAALDQSQMFQMDENAPVFKYLLISAVPAIAFAHGSNDVSNGVGPFFGIIKYYLSTLKSSSTDGEQQVTSQFVLACILIVGGVAIATPVFYCSDITSWLL